MKTLDAVQTELKHLIELSRQLFSSPPRPAADQLADCNLQLLEITRSLDSLLELKRNGFRNSGMISNEKNRLRLIKKKINRLSHTTDKRLRCSWLESLRQPIRLFVNQNCQSLERIRGRSCISLYMFERHFAFSRKHCIELEKGHLPKLDFETTLELLEIYEHLGNGTQKATL